MMIQERVDAWGRVNKMALDNPLVNDMFDCSFVHVFGGRSVALQASRSPFYMCKNAFTNFIGVAES